MGEQLRYFIELIVIMVCLNLITSNIESVNGESLPSVSTLNENLKGNPARKPPRFGKRALYLLLAPKALSYKMTADVRQHPTQRDFGRDMTFNERNAYYDTVNQLLLSNNIRR